MTDEKENHAVFRFGVIVLDLTTKLKNALSEPISLPKPGNIPMEACAKLHPELFATGSLATVKMA